jgi:hypothetical protein
MSSNNKSQSITNIDPISLAYYRSMNYSDEQIRHEIENQIIYPTNEQINNKSNKYSEDLASTTPTSPPTPQPSAPPFSEELVHPSNEPTVTCLIIAHGSEESYKISSHINKNIRILSRAGVPGCLGTCGMNDYDDIFHEYKNNIDSNLPSYQKLEKMQQKFLSEEQCAILYDTTNRENSDKKYGKYSLDIFSKKQHSRIFKPVYDHTYSFTWSPEFKQGIHILEVNNPPNSEIEYKDNLLNKKFYLDEFNNPQQKRSNIEKILRIVFEKIQFPSDIKIKLDYKSIEDVRLNFNPVNEDESKIKGMFFNNWVKQILIDFPKNKQDFFTPKNISEILVTYQNIVKKNKLDKIINKFILYFEENNYNSGDIIEIIFEIEKTYKTIYFLKRQITTEEEESNRKLIEKFYPKIFSNESDCLSFIIKIMRNYGYLYSILVDNINNGDIDVKIKMSTIIDYLKSKGYKIINLIDLSCRLVDETHYEEENLEHLNYINKEEHEKTTNPTSPYNKNMGGSKKSNKSKKNIRKKSNKSKKNIRKNLRNRIPSKYQKRNMFQKIKHKK